jgi:hypothetical protein
MSDDTHLGDAEGSAVAALSDSEDEEDATAWRAGAEPDDAAEAELDSRVAGAFESLNMAIAHNNEVEAAHAKAVEELARKKAAGVEELAQLERRHANQLKKIEKFRADQAAAHKAAARLTQISTELSMAREVLQCANEALELQREAAEDAQRQRAATAAATSKVDPETAAWSRSVTHHIFGSSSGSGKASSSASAKVEEMDGRAKSDAFIEAERVLEERQSDASARVRALERQRRKCARGMEKLARRVIESSAALGDLASAALPYLAKQANIENRLGIAEASVRARGEETAQAKAEVRTAMGDLERISNDIMAQQRQQEEEKQQEVQT